MKTPARYIPQNSKPIYRLGVEAVVYVTDSKGPAGDRFCAMGYSGKRGKADFNHWFRTVEQRSAYVTRYFDGIAARLKVRADRKAEQAAKRAAGHDIKPGDVMATSWGYDQTNVDFYEVVAVTPATILVQPIGSHVVETGFMSGNATPDKSKREDKKIRSLFSGHGFSIDGHSASKYTDGQPRHCSWYA